MNNHTITKGEKRAERREKARRAPTGGSVGAQRKRLETANFYAGGSKKVKPRVRVTIGK